MNEEKKAHYTLKVKNTTINIEYTQEISFILGIKILYMYAYIEVDNKHIFRMQSSYDFPRQILNLKTIYKVYNNLKVKLLDERNVSVSELSLNEYFNAYLRLMVYNINTTF